MNLNGKHYNGKNLNGTKSTSAPEHPRSFVKGLRSLAALVVVTPLFALGAAGTSAAADEAAPERGADMGSGVEDGIPTVERRSNEPTAQPRAAGDRVSGVDVAEFEPNYDFNAHYAEGYRFAYVRATQGVRIKDSSFSRHYTASYEAGMIRGAYHFAEPGATSGAEQADYFIDNGGGWSGDGKTLPGVLDLEGAYWLDDPCWGLNHDQMNQFISEFTTRYKERTGRDAVIYTNTNWWKQCTGNTAQFADTNPLWVARWDSETAGELPAGWEFWTFWQYAGDPDFNHFSGGMDRLEALANG